MRRKKRILLMLTFLLGIHAMAAAQDYTRDNLRVAAQALHVDGQADSLAPGQTAQLTTSDGLRVVVRKNQRGAVDHIGLQLFTDTVRTFIPSPVYDFLEYAVLNWKYKFTPNDLYLSKVLFRKGDWNTLLRENLLALSPAISNMDDRLYVVCWQRDGRVVAEVGIPIDYELLTNDTRRHMERDFVSQLAADTLFMLPQPEVVEERQLKIYGTEGLFILQRDTFLLPELNNHEYFVLRTVVQQSDVEVNGQVVSATFEAVMPVPVVSTEFPAESFSNIMLSTSAAVPEARLTLDCHLSDYRHDTLTISMSQLRHFLQAEGCQLYYASSGVTGQVAGGMLMAVNTDKGYNHLVNVKMPVDALCEAQPQVQADAYLFIPLLKLERIYGTAPGKKKWSETKHIKEP